nr:zeta toxin family protein [Bifidobacterium aerophilum]
MHDVFDRQIRDDVFRKATISRRPLTIFLGGQPGAGKTRGQNLAIALHPSESPIKIIGDDLRQYQDDYWELIEKHPLEMPDATKQSSGTWIAMCVAEANRQGYSIVIEGTWRNANTVLDEARNAKDLERRTHAVIMAVPKELSRISILERYYKDRLDGKPSRWTPLAAHDETVKGLYSSVKQIADDSAIDRFTIVDRNGTCLFDETDMGIRRKHGAEIWFKHHDRTLTDDELSQVKKQLSIVELGLRDDGIDNPEAEQVIRDTKALVMSKRETLSLIKERAEQRLANQDDSPIILVTPKYKR